MILFQMFAIFDTTLNDTSIHEKIYRYYSLFQFFI